MLINPQMCFTFFTTFKCKGGSFGPPLRFVIYEPILKNLVLNESLSYKDIVCTKKNKIENILIELWRHKVGQVAILRIFQAFSS